MDASSPEFDTSHLGPDLTFDGGFPFARYRRGTHGKVDQYDRSQLAAIKDRVEGVIRFVYHLARAPRD